MEEITLDIKSLYEIYYPISVKSVHIRNSNTLRLVSAMGAESICINNSPLLESIKYGKSLRHIYLPNTGITEFTLPKNCSLLYSGAFCGCKKLRKIDISNSLDLPSCTFSGCSNLIEVTLPNNITTLETGVFEGCRNLKYIRGGKPIEKINCKLNECNSLEFIDKWTVFCNLKDKMHLADLYFSKSLNNLVGIVLCEIKDMWIIWSFINNQYYFMNDRYYDSDGTDDYNSYDGGREIIDDIVKIDDIIVFNITEKPIIKFNNQVCIFWNSQCTNVELKGKLFRPTDGLAISKKDQQFLLDYYNTIEFEVFCDNTRRKIEDLDIDSIIKSYHITRKMYWQIRPGRDDFEWTISETTISYSDPYIESLLPIENGKGYTSGCWNGSNEDEENILLQKAADKETAQRKQLARNAYSKFKHYSFLLRKYFEERKIYEEKIQNKYHIERVKQFIQPIYRLRNEIEDAYALIHAFHCSDFITQADILDGYERQ